MSERWRAALRYDPVGPLLEVEDPALAFFARRDLLGEEADIARVLSLPKVQRLLNRQLPDGSWRYAGQRRHEYPAHHYPLLETWRQFRVLVQQYGLTRDQEGVARAAERLFSWQTREGDIRGFLGNQHAPYYTGAIMGLLVDAGYEADPRVAHALKWLLAMRQEDGGWIVPLLGAGLGPRERDRLCTEPCDPVPLDRRLPFSHNWTGMVLRGFAAHPDWRHREEVQRAGRLLKSRFFQQDCYGSYQAASCWVRFQFPFWWNNLVAALDTLTLLGFEVSDQDMQQALDWLVKAQQPNGLWRATYVKGQPKRETPSFQDESRWVSLAIGRLLRRLLA